MDFSHNGNYPALILPYFSSAWVSKHMQTGQQLWFEKLLTRQSKLTKPYTRYTEPLLWWQGPGQAGVPAVSQLDFVMSAAIWRASRGMNLFLVKVDLNFQVNIKENSQIHWGSCRAGATHLWSGIALWLKHYRNTYSTHSWELMFRTTQLQVDLPPPLAGCLSGPMVRAYGTWANQFQIGSEKDKYHMYHLCVESLKNRIQMNLYTKQK